MKTRLALPSLAVALALALALPASASDDARPGPLSKEEQRLVLLDANAGEAVKQVRFLRPIHAYEVVGPLNLLVWETPFRAWLLDLRQGPACARLEQQVAVSIDTLSDSLNSNNGYIRGDAGLSCKIERIREVDVKAWKQAERDAGIRD